MDRKIAHNLMTSSTPMGRAYRDYIMMGLTDEQVSKILGIDDTSTNLVREQIAKNTQGENEELNSKYDC
ncbi:hypothetical protein KSP24_07735 [Paenibacillus sp. AK121]|uniref:hypothetical protein n=1 Tax=Paenibacillus TaxID=44249 RepID=UPI001C214D99|nr:hypothetical protein [Paenibacillus sp. AK121]MBU9706819.1 hypothetical protein [Paenibacillus sp. AK121]MEE4567103.1 hypothetical protein [Paenibacillus polymyxa]